VTAKRFLFALLLALLPRFSANAATSTEVKLLLAADAARPGETVMAGVRLKMAPRWHTYWRNAGDSGSPTKIEWQLPEGVTAGEIQWPVPEKFVTAGLTTYAYHDEVLLMVPLTVTGNAAPGRKQLEATVSWLECEELCIPGKADVRAVLEVGQDSKPSSDAALFDSWQKRLPKTDSAITVAAQWEQGASQDTRPLVLEVSSHDIEDLFPYGADNYEVQAATERVSSSDGKVRFRKIVRKLDGEWPREILGVIVAKGSESLVGHQITAAIAGPGGPIPGALASGEARTRPVQPLLRMLLFAFIGGLVLNIMPCVLPVIALKILGFVNQSKESPGRVRQLGLIYGLGVLCSFLLLAGIVIAVQHAGRAASWGMQFQNPKFLVAMTILVTLVALNLFGVFEVNLSGRAMGAAGDLASKEGAPGAFFNGVLATTLATPCTAPFLAPALGFAFAQSAGIIILMFLTVGAGLAAPYIVLSWHPAWLKFLPRPGLWMEKFKNAMGFPMLATAVWLFSLTIGHFGKKGPLWFGVFLVVLTSAVWVWGEFVQRGRKGRGFAVGAAVALLAIAYFAVLEAQLNWRSPVRKENTGGSIAGEPGGIEWQPWSEAAVARARAEGKPVFVDFTADWCVTCQANKKTSIEISSVRAKLKEISAVTLLGDYTREDDAITAELQRWGRAGVPLVLVYPADSTAEPLVLPEVLTPGIVLSALSKAAPKSAGKESGAAKGETGMVGETDWPSWSAEAVAEARAAGKPVLVQFTANWCANCNVLERRTLAKPAVLAKLREIGAVVLRADMSDENEPVVKELRRFGRAGIPFILIYPRNPTVDPMKYDWLTESDALQALQDAAKG